MFPGRGADCPGLAPGAGLLRGPGVAPAGLGALLAGASGVADSDDGAAGSVRCGASAFGAAAFGVSRAAGFSAGAASLDAPGLAGALAPGFGPGAAGFLAPWEGALAAGLDAAALSPPAGNAVRSFLATGGSTVDDAPRTNSPSS